MSASKDQTQRFNDATQMLENAGQEHLLQWWDDLDDAQRNQLLGEVESIPWESLKPLIQSHVLAKPKVNIPRDLKPADVFPQPPDEARKASYEDARRTGESLLSAGQVAAFTVAGGQGTRLGYDGPKGEVKVTPDGTKSLFAIFGESVLAARQRYSVSIPWYIMTSLGNHDRTVAYLEENNYFNLPKTDVMLFSQAMLPAFDMKGKAILSNKHRLALAPDGHGGSLKALYTSKALEDMKSRGVKVISYFQVDNPLVKPFDPLFLGLHVTTNSEMSTKISPKADDLEKVGNVCIADGLVQVVEYTEFPDEFATAKNDDGSRKFDAGNLAMHALNVAFVDRIVGETFSLPYRRAEKKVPFVDNTGTTQSPETPNGVKLEMFVFDALTLAKNPLVLQVDRAEEFSPVKNATGVDSLETSQRDQNRRACRWLEAAGLTVPRDNDGEPTVTVTITPSFALDANDLGKRKNEVPAFAAGDKVTLT